MNRIIARTYLPIRNKRFYNPTSLQKVSTPDHKIKNTSRHYLDIQALADSLKHKSSWKKGELNSMVLIKNETRKELLIVLHSDTKIKSFQRDQSITLNVVEGKIKLKVNNIYIILSSDQYYSLSENVKYSITTLEETTLLMTIFNTQIPN